MTAEVDVVTAWPSVHDRRQAILIIEPAKIADSLIQKNTSDKNNSGESEADTDSRLLVGAHKQSND